MDSKTWFRMGISSGSESTTHVAKKFHRYTTICVKNRQGTFENDLEPSFRDYHLLLDEHADQIFATTDAIAERVRKLGASTLRSIGDVARRQTLLDNDASYVTPLDMLAELREDNRGLAARMRECHGICDERGDVASASFLETWIDEAERRVWFLFEATRRGDSPGR